MASQEQQARPREAMASSEDSDGSSYVLASGEATPSAASDFEHVSQMDVSPSRSRADSVVSEDGWSLASAPAGQTPIEDARAQISHAELYERLRAMAIARSEARSSPSSGGPSSVSSVPTDTTEMVNLIALMGITSGRETPIPDLTPLFAPDGTYLGRICDFTDDIDANAGTGSKTPRTYEDVAPEAMDELAAFRHSWLEEVGVVPAEQVQMKLEWALDEEDVQHIEKLRSLGFSTKDIEDAQIHRYNELIAASEGKGKDAASPAQEAAWHGFHDLYEARRLQEEFDKTGKLPIEVERFDAGRPVKSSRPPGSKAARKQEAARKKEARSDKDAKWDMEKTLDEWAERDRLALQSGDDELDLFKYKDDDDAFMDSLVDDTGVPDKWDDLGAKRSASVSSASSSSTGR